MLFATQKATSNTYSLLLAKNRQEVLVKSEKVKSTSFLQNLSIFVMCGQKNIFKCFRMDLNPCVNEASAYADMKHSLRTYEVFATQI